MLYKLTTCICKTRHKCEMLFLAFVATLAMVSLPTPSASQEDTIPASVIFSNSQQVVCPSDEVWESTRDETTQNNRNLIRNTILPTLCLAGQTQTSAVASCSEIPSSCPSEYYWVRNSNGTAVQVYCDMDRVCGCNSTGGWTRVANLNMSDPSQQCPGDWILQPFSSEPRRLCGRRSSSGGCSPAVYSTYGFSYNQVCGRVTGYAYRSPDAFGQTSPWTIEGPYVDGVSLTHGPPGTRQHIWTFAAGIQETVSVRFPDFSCPCVSGSAAASPSYVGNDYFCESGNAGTGFRSVLYSSDPLWDGQGCGSPPCCELNSPLTPGVTAPWFCKQMIQATTDNIEVRICGDQFLTDEDILIERIELYIR